MTTHIDNGYGFLHEQCQREELRTSFTSFQDFFRYFRNLDWEIVGGIIKERNGTRVAIVDDYGDRPITLRYYDAIDCG